MRILLNEEHDIVKAKLKVPPTYKIPVFSGSATRTRTRRCWSRMPPISTNSCTMADERRFRESLCGLHPRLPVLLHLFYEAVYRPPGTLGDLPGCQALAGDSPPGAVCRKGALHRLCYGPLSAPGRDVRAHPRAAGAAQGQRGPHHLLCLAHLPRPHRWKGHHRPGEGAMQPDLAGKPQPAGQLQSGHPGLHPGKASAASAPVSGNLLQREPRLLGEAGCGAEGLCRRARVGLCDQRRQQEAAV